MNNILNISRHTMDATPQVVSDVIVKVKLAENHFFDKVLSLQRRILRRVQLMFFMSSALLIPRLAFTQLPELGTSINFALFTASGALGNTGVSTITGDIGTDLGAITGFDAPTVVNGNIEWANGITAQAAIDVQAAYDEIFGIAPTESGHLPAFGNNETLLPGVYIIGGAGSIAGVLNLDGDNNPNAVFIFQFAGALTTGASASVNLINQASACNVFWIAEGEIAMAALSDMKGTFIASNGAVSMGAGGVIEGRLLSTVGAATVYDALMTIPICDFDALPIRLLSFEARCIKQQVVLDWKTATETNNDYFTVERSEDGNEWNTLTTVDGAGNSATQRDYTYKDLTFNSGTTYYQLKQTDYNGDFSYEAMIGIKKCGNFLPEKIIIYPNPSEGIFNLLFSGEEDDVIQIQIVDAHGHQVFMSLGFESFIDLSHFGSGLYFMSIIQNSEITYVKMMVSH